MENKDWDDFFKTGEIETEPDTRTKLEIDIWDEYGKSFQTRRLTDAEYPNEDICANCTGCGTFKIDGEDKYCVQDKQEGECFYRYIDYEQFGREVEVILLNQQPLTVQ